MRVWLTHVHEMLPFVVLADDRRWSSGDLVRDHARNPMVARSTRLRTV